MNMPDDHQQIKALAERVDRLIEVSRRLQDENRSLRQCQEQLTSERSQLMSKNELAR